MAALRRGCLFQTSWMFVRHRGKINIKNPIPGPIERRLLEIMSAPIVLRDLDILKSPAQKCQEWRQKNKQLAIEEENPWEEFLVRRCKEMFERNRMVAVFQALPSKAEDKKVVHNKLLKKGMRLQYFPNQVSLRAVDQTRFVNLGPLFVGENLFVIGEEVHLTDMVKITRKVPHMALLAGLVDDRILSREEIKHYAALSNIETVRGELVGILSSAASKTHRLLSSQQLKLSQNLEQLIKQRSVTDNETDNETDSPS